MCVPETFFPTDQLQSKKENDGPQATNEEKLSVTSSQPLLLGFLGVQTVCYPPDKSIIKMFRQENQETVSVRRQLLQCRIVDYRVGQLFR